MNWANAPGPLLQNLILHLETRGILKARLVCKQWREGIGTAHTPACVVLPANEEHVSGAGRALLSSTHMLVLALDEMHLGEMQQQAALPALGGDKPAAQEQQNDQAPLATAASTQLEARIGLKVQSQMQLLSYVCRSLKGLKLLFKPAVFRMSYSEGDFLSEASILWLSKITHSWGAFAPRMHKLHIDLGPTHAPDPTTLASVLQLPCLQDFLLSCLQLSPQHLQVVSQIKTLVALTLSEKHQVPDSPPLWASHSCGGGADQPRLDQLTSLVLDSPRLTACHGLPAFVTSTRLRRLELLGSPSRPGSAEQQVGSSCLHASQLAAALPRLPHLHTLALHTPGLCDTEWAVLSALCASHQLTELRLNHWRAPDCGPRALKALQIPESHSCQPTQGTRALGLGHCLVAKATLQSPRQLPSLLGSSSCRLRVLHLAFKDGDGPASSNGGGSSSDECDPGSAWSAILQCAHLLELNLTRTLTLPLTDAVLKQIPDAMPMLEVLQYNGRVEVGASGWGPLAQLAHLRTLALGSICPWQDVQQVQHRKLEMHLGQLPQQLECVSFLNAELLSNAGSSGFPPGLRRLSLKSCHCISMEEQNTSQGQERTRGDLKSLLQPISCLPGLMQLQLFVHRDLVDAASWGMLTRLHHLEELSITLATSILNPQSSRSRFSMQALQEVAGIPSLRHLRFIDEGSDLYFTKYDLVSFTTKVAHLKTLELGLLKDFGAGRSRSLNYQQQLDAHQDVAPYLARHLPQCRFKLVIDDYMTAIETLDQNLSLLVGEAPAMNEENLLNDPDLLAELQALEIQDEGGHQPLV